MLVDIVVFPEPEIDNQFESKPGPPTTATNILDPSDFRNSSAIVLAQASSFLLIIAQYIQIVF